MRQTQTPLNKPITKSEQHRDAIAGLPVNASELTTATGARTSPIGSMEWLGAVAGSAQCQPEDDDRVAPYNGHRPARRTGQPANPYSGRPRRSTRGRPFSSDTTVLGSYRSTT